MKRNYFLLAIISTLFASFTYGQTYQFTYSNSTYVPINNGISLNNGMPWDDPFYRVPIGFSFSIDGFTYDTLQLSSELLFFGDSNLTGVGSLFLPHSADLIDRGYDLNQANGGTNSLSPISYATTGIAGSRIFKLQFENAGFYEELDQNAVALDSTNFQVWLYEGTNEIAVHMGPNSMNNDSLVYYGEDGLGMLLVPKYDFTLDSLYGNAYMVTGDSTSPNLSITNSLDSLLTMNGTPINGAVFQFTPLTVGLKDFSNDLVDFNLYPNPATESITIELAQVQQNQPIQLIDLSGKIVLNTRSSAKKQQLDVSTLSKGIYFVKVGDRHKKLTIYR